MDENVHAQLMIQHAKQLKLVVYRSLYHQNLGCNACGRNDWSM